MRFNFFCSCYIVCYSSVVVMCGWCFLFRCWNVHFLLYIFSNTEQNGWAKKKLACSLAPQLCRTNCWCLWFVFFSFLFVSCLFFGFNSRSFSFGLHFSFFIIYQFLWFLLWISFFSSGCAVGRFHVDWYMKISSCLVTVAVNTIAFRWYYRCVNATSSTCDSTRKLYLWNRKKEAAAVVTTTTTTQFTKIWNTQTKPSMFKR